MNLSPLCHNCPPEGELLPHTGHSPRIVDLPDTVE